MTDDSSSRFLHRAGHSVETVVDKLKYALKQRMGYHEPLAVQAYHGYGTSRQVYLFARVLEDEGLPAPTSGDSAWENFKRMYKMLETDEVPSAVVRIRFAGQEKTVESDQDGYLATSFEAKEGPLRAFAPGRAEVVYDLLSPKPVDGQPRDSFRGEVFIPRPDARFVVISDIDDTVMHTQATSLLKMAVSTLLHNAYGRVAFPGVAAFYRALHRADADGQDGLNPFFYLTSSMWSIYDLIRVFLEVNRIPAGPLLMRDLGIDRDKFIKGSHDEHKLGRVLDLVKLYPDQKFILIGDTGQRDAWIYTEACRHHADRILAVYLRDVSLDARDAEVKPLVEEIRSLGVECVAAEDSAVHAEHAAAMGWIDPAALPEIRGDVEQDKQAEAAGKASSK